MLAGRRGGGFDVLGGIDGHEIVALRPGIYAADCAMQAAMCRELADVAVQQPRDIAARGVCFIRRSGGRGAA